MEVPYRPYAQAFLCGGVAFVVLLIALFAFFGASPDAAGRLLFLTLFPAWITGYLAKRSPQSWSTVKIALVYAALFVAVIAVSSAGYRRG